MRTEPVVCPAQIDTIIFDLDGTLTDSQTSFVNCINFALSSLGRTMLPAQTLLPYIGPPIHGTFQSLLGTDDSSMVEEAVGLYRRRLGAEGISENTVYPGIALMLAALKDAGNRLFVATAKPTAFAMPILEHCGLQGYFTGVYGSKLHRANTPKGELIRAILAEHSIPTEHAAMVGDRRHDIKGARECSVFSVGVTYGYGSVLELREAGADMLCDSPEHLQAFFIGK